MLLQWFMNSLLRGLLAGTIATAPMTLVMQALHRWPYPERDSLPPKQITFRIASSIGLKRKLDKPTINALTIVNHFGYGAAMGGAYGLFARRIKVHPALKGAIWGCIVWTASYLGWLPVANILPPATEHSRRRNFLMLTSHLVWGITTAVLAERSVKGSSEATS